MSAPDLKTPNLDEVVSNKPKSLDMFSEDSIRALGSHLDKFTLKFPDDASLSKPVQAAIRLNIEDQMANGTIAADSPEAERLVKIPSLKDLGVKACDADVVQNLSVGAKQRNGCDLER